jgi:hypothetical protein
MTTETLVTEAANLTESAAPVTAPAPSTLLDGEGASDSTATAEGGETEGATPPETAAEDSPSEDAAGAPEAYEDFTLPEGVALDADTDAELKALAKDLNLTQTQAQKVADLGAVLTQRWATQFQEQLTSASEDWATATKADKELGGEKLTGTLTGAKAALDKFGTPELRELLQTSRLGNHPEVVRLLARVGQAISDDNAVVTGAPPSSKGKSLADKLYGSSN